MAQPNVNRGLFTVIIALGVCVIGFQNCSTAPLAHDQADLSYAHMATCGGTRAQMASQIHVAPDGKSALMTRDNCVDIQKTITDFHILGDGTLSYQGNVYQPTEL